MSRWTVLEDTDRRAASVEVLGRRPSLISWWIVWRRRQSGRSLNAPARPTKKRYQLSAVSCQFREPLRLPWSKGLGSTFYVRRSASGVVNVERRTSNVERLHQLFHERQQFLGCCRFFSVRVELQVLLQVLPGGGLLVQVERDHAEKEMPHGQVRFGLDGLGQRGLRLLHLSLVVGLHSLVVENLGGI